LLATIVKLVVVATGLAHTSKSSPESQNSLSLTSNERESAGAGRHAVFEQMCESRRGVIHYGRETQILRAHPTSPLPQTKPWPGQLCTSPPRRASANRLGSRGGLRVAQVVFYPGLSTVNRTLAVPLATMPSL
jgi:hypothetical protein